MKLQPTNDSGSNVILTGAILLANFDFNGLSDYALKAVIGGAIWMTFRLASDYLSSKIKK
jgi:hypothetical protein